MHRYKVGEVVQVLNIEDSRRMHNNIPRVYPKPYTMGIVKNMNTIRDTQLYIKYLGIDAKHNMWWHLGKCIRYISHKELQAMIQYYKMYQNATCFSVRDFYDKASTAKKVAEDAIKARMQEYHGAEYRVLCGNTQHFTAAFTAFGMLYVITSNREYIIDMQFMQNYLENSEK